MSSGSTWLLEVVTIPVSNLEQSRVFYRDQIGFVVDYEMVDDPENGWVQLTPPGSGCSIQIKAGRATSMAPGSMSGVLLVVPDVTRAHAALTERGVKVTPVRAFGENPRETPHPLDNVGIVFFTDPDGNEWAVQQISDRARNDAERPPPV